MKSLQANELRIGNFVNLCFEHKPGWFPAKVTEIRVNNTINTDTTDNEENKQYYYEGVPLDESWLLKFGFKRSENMLHSFDHPTPSKPEDEYKDLGQCFPTLFFNTRPEVNAWMDSQTRVTIKYVHQLQNLYLALTKEELCLQTTKE